MFHSNPVNTYIHKKKPSTLKKQQNSRTRLTLGNILNIDFSQFKMPIQEDKPDKSEILFKAFKSRFKREQTT